MKQFQYSDLSAYQEDLKKQVTIDPFDFAGTSGKKEILMVVAINDSTVPIKNQWNLAKAWGDPETVTLKGWHLQAILFSYGFYKNKFLQFFDK